MNEGFDIICANCGARIRLTSAKPFPDLQEEIDVSIVDADDRLGVKTVAIWCQRCNNTTEPTS